MIRELDDITFTEWFTQLGGKRGSFDRMWDAIAYALGFLDCDNIGARAMLTNFMLFAIRTEANVLRMLDGSPQTGLRNPIIKYLEDCDAKINLSAPCRELVHDVGPKTGLPTRVRGIKIGSDEVYHEFDTVICALDVPGIKKVLPESFRKYDMFNNIYNIDCVPIATVQVRFDGWVTKLNDHVRSSSS